VTLLAAAIVGSLAVCAWAALAGATLFAVVTGWLRAG